MWIEPVVLEGRVVRLEPLNQAHAEGLREAGDAEIFAYTSIAPAAWTPEGLAAYVARSLAVPNRWPFAVMLRATGRAVGTSSYMDARPADRGVEIGYTWYGRRYQGTLVNPESKYLLLRHAFETLGAVRVQLKTDGRNLQSQAAIAKLGAVREGVLRKHLIMPDGYIRDTVMFSIVADEWPAVKAELEARLGYVPADGFTPPG